MTPAALNKAEALDRHLSGASRALTHIALCDREAWELIDWYKATVMDYAPASDQALFKVDLEQARAHKNPWVLLSGFEIRGYQIARIADEVH